jgi:hypothetical protein
MEGFIALLFQQMGQKRKGNYDSLKTSLPLQSGIWVRAFFSSFVFRLNR